MVQLALWLAIVAAEGLAASLQHWDSLIEDRVAALLGMPTARFRLVATMPLGYPVRNRTRRSGPIWHAWSLSTLSLAWTGGIRRLPPTQPARPGEVASGKPDAAVSGGNRSSRRAG
jgi:hypothetical protein